MKKRNTKRTVDTATKARTYSLIAMCMLLFVAGLFVAGRQHFSSMDYGMKNSRLRKQVDELESEKRRLLLARETFMSPAEIKKAAKRVGLFSDESPEQGVAKVTPATKQTVLPTTNTPSNPLITKTVAVAPAARVENASLQKNPKTTVPEKKASAQKRTQSAE